MDAQHNALSDQINDVQDAIDLNATNLANVPTLLRGVGATAGLLHVRNSITFNAATTGSVAATPTHVIFTITGRVFVQLLTCFCSSTLTSGGTPAITLGTLNDVDAFMAAPTGGATDLAAGDWWTAPTSSAGSVVPLITGSAGDRSTAQISKLLSENIGMAIPVSTVTGGVLIFDVWYYPITDDGLLVPTVN